MNRSLPMVLRSAVFVALLCCFAAGTPASGAIRVTKKPVVVKHTEFNPANPAPGTPHLNAGEAATCLSQYDAAVQLQMQPSTRRLGNGKFHASLTVTTVQIELKCLIEIWLPIGANAKLKAHEEGHRSITDKVYAEVAEKAAKVAADKLDGRRFDAEGDSAADAEKAANEKLTAAHTAMIQAYLDETSRAGKKINDKFDDLTQHGTNRLDEAEAMKQAWAAFPPPLWTAPKSPTTKPATKPVMKK